MRETLASATPLAAACCASTLAVVAFCRYAEEKLAKLGLSLQAAPPPLCKLCCSEG